ncbi:MAG: L-threonine 3-dehydrogenase [Gammaproteobacteria bacterium RIFCSPHIGHO2_12_FULL_42_13]|nr:MAG: L-threonine 3-dehydrogenase [Gammaproteobacteria bacterium RIFCSPHIGHO2_12_FULL_42_13]
MKALVKRKPEPGIWLEEVATPTMGPNDVLIKIKKTAICGTDIHIYNWDEWAQQTIPVPLVIGHEFVGEIVAIGKEVKGFAIGDRVSGEGHVACGHCRNCRAGRSHLCRKNESTGVTRPGCFAEYLVLPASNAYPLPAGISDDQAAILDPLGNATHTALSFDVVGEDVLITGAGPVGIMATAIARHVGARHIVITDVNEYRLALAKKMGASLTINPVKSNLTVAMTELGMTEGFDVGLEMSGNSNAFQDMIVHMNHAGRIALLGFLPRNTTIDWSMVIMKGLILKGIYGREMFETWYKMICMLQSGLKIDPVITHHFAVDDYAKAFDTTRTGQCGKVVLNWD